METTIRFIGLFVIMLEAAPYQILMPNFPNLKPKHDSVIAYRANDRNDSASNWEMTGTFERNKEKWGYVEVHKQAITITGATGPDPSLTPLAGLPHLSCCCTAFKPPRHGGQGIKNEYSNPDLTPSKKQGAQISFKQGRAQVVRDDPKGDEFARRETLITMTTASEIGITITGTNGEGQGAGNKRTIAFYPGAQIIFGNTPICIIKNDCKPLPGSADWKSYYEMAVEKNDCQSSPSVCKSCRTSDTQCPSSSCRSTKLGAMVTVDCSNSGWP